MSISNNQPEGEVNGVSLGAGQQSRENSHIELSVSEPWETDRNVITVALAKRAILSPFPGRRQSFTMTTQDDLGQLTSLLSGCED